MTIAFLCPALVVMLLTCGVSTAATISYQEDTADIANPDRGL